MRPRLLAFAAFAIGIVVTGCAEAQSWRQVTCSFTHGVIASLDSDSARPLAVDAGFTLVFSDIDRERATARMIEYGRDPRATRNPRASEVTWVEGAESFAFVEMASDRVTITTIFLTHREMPAKAVHSRHVLYDTPVASQYFGGCSPE